MNRHIELILCSVLAITIALSSYVIGYKMADDKHKNNDKKEEEVVIQSFYATITDIGDNSVTVKGMEVNDINFRGEFVLNVDENSKIEWRHTNIEFAELEVGDNISIYFTGDIQETAPAKISNVLKIQLLDDEK